MLGLKRFYFLGIVIFFILLAKSYTYSQSVGNYTVARSIGHTYNSVINTGNSMPGWRYSGNFSEDDNRSIATEIGFDFWYNGQRYTQFSVSTNGFLDFSNSVDDGGPQCDDYGYCNFRFSDSNINNGTWLALAPFYDDMTTAGGVDPLGTSIKYLLSGTAPNRVLTVEWAGMAVYQNTTPNINFQVKIYESTGVIEYNYGTMDNGTNTFSYTVGINASSISSPPAVTELLSQQTENSSNFSNTAQDNLSTMPAANSRLTFTPPTPASPSGSLSFNAISNTGMTLNWADWATNEVGYVVYHSTDDINYYFDTQTAANATSTIITGLLPSTNYYWKVFAVTEGNLGSALTGSETTLAPGLIISIKTGRWDKTTTWDCGCIPTAADNVIIADGHRVTMRTSGLACNDLTIGQGASGELRFNRNNPRDLSINGNLVINNGAFMHVAAGTSNATHTLNIKGNIINNGTLNLATDANSLCISNFIKKDGNQTVSGNGATTNFYTINIDKQLKNNTLEITSTNFTCDPDALSFTGNGTFKFSSAGINNFSLFSTTKDIPLNGKIWMNSAGSTMSFAAGINLKGDLLLDAGQVVIGDATDENVISFGGTLEINNGNMSIAGRYTRNNTESTANFIQTGGTLTLPVVGSTSTTEGPFNMDVTGSSLAWSGGSIIIQQEGGNGTQHLGYNTSGVTTSNITGGILEIGNANTPASQVMQINAATPIGNLLVNNANATGQLSGNNLAILSDVTLASGSLDDNGLDIDLQGDWLVTGGSFITGVTGTVTMSGLNQSVTTANSAFNHLVLSGTGIKSFNDNLDINGNLINNATMNLVNTGFQVNLGGNWINNGSFNRNNEVLVLDGSLVQDIGGTSANDFTNISINKSGGSVSVESNLNLFGTLEILSPTTLDVDGAGNTSIFTLISKAINDSRIAALPAGASIIGNLVFQKYFVGQGKKYWRHISSAVSDATVADLQSEIPISGAFTGNDNGKDFGTFSIPANAYPSLYYYDNNAGLPSGTLDDRWIPYPTTSNTEILTNAGTEARGYAIWVRDTGPITYDLNGTVNQQSIDFMPTAHNEGWNLLGNPFPSDIDWDATGWTKTNIQGNTINIWDGTSYLTWNGSTGSLGNGLIAKGQGFWVRASAGTIGLTATEQVKTASTASTYRTFNTEQPQVLEISVSASGYNDRAYIQFLDTASMNFDNADAPKLQNAIFNLSSASSDSVDLSINVINGAQCAFDIPLKLTDAWNDQYSLSWNVNPDLLTLYQIKLEDTYTQQVYNLNSGDVGFSFDFSDLNSSNIENRFIIHFTTNSIQEPIASGSQNCASGNAEIVIKSSQLGVDYTLANNKQEITSISGTGQDLVIQVDSLYLQNGQNIFNLVLNSTLCEAAEPKSTEVLVDILPKPIINFDANQNILYNATGNKGYWFLNNELLSSNSNNAITPDFILGGAYQLQVENNNCNYKSDPFLIMDVGKEITANTNISLVPNPVDKSFQIIASGDSLLGATLTIIDMNGKVYFTGKYQGGSQVQDVAGFKQGMYIVIREKGDQIKRLRMLKI